MWGKGGIAIRKIYCTGSWKLSSVPLYNPLKSNMGAHVHKTTYGPLIDTALHMRANPSLGRGPWKSRLFSAPNGTRLTALCHFSGPNPHSLTLVIDFPASKALCTEHISNEEKWREALRNVGEWMKVW
jgi:hypothetical protein